MKRDWVRIDEDFSGKGARNYHRKCEFNRIVKLDAEYRRDLRKYEKHTEFFQPGFEEVTQDQIRKLEKDKKKKRKKKFFKLWSDCISLSDYTGTNIINLQYMKKRRELRYKYEVINYTVFGFEKQKKEKKIIYKGLINSKAVEL
jgi:hypothetical protein